MKTDLLILHYQLKVMKKIIFTLLLLSAAFAQEMHAQILFPQTGNKTFTTTSPSSVNASGGSSSGNNFKTMFSTQFHSIESRIQINGLGNIAASQNGSALNPSANIYAKFLPFRHNPFGQFYLGYNLGSNLDSTNIDSLRLGNLFLPDRNKSAYIVRFEQNVLPYLRILFGKDSSNTWENTPDSDGYIIRTQISPFVEYNFNRINFRGSKEDSSKIQSNTWMFGINIVRTIEKNNNTVAIQVSPYIKTVAVTDNTYSLYSKIFSPGLGGTSPPRHVNFLGLILGLQINRFQFSFVIDDTRNKELKGTALYGGVYTLRATVIGDFIKL